MSNYGQPPQDPHQSDPQQWPSSPGNEPTRPMYGDPMGPPQPAGGPGPYGGAPNDLSTQSKGFFGALFDFSFNHFVTPMIVKAVYVLATVLLAIFALLFVVSSFIRDPALGVFVLLGTVIGFFVYLALIRMTLEFYLAVVRMSEDIHHRLR